MFSTLLRSFLNTTKSQTKFCQRSSSYHHRTNNTSFTNDSIKRIFFVGGAAAVLTSGSALIYYRNDINIIQKAEAKVAVVKAEKDKSAEKFIPPARKDLPTYKLDEIKKHGKDSGKIWVVYKHGVYDVTEFHKNHPGGDKILLAAGGSVEPYWALYAQHKTEEVMEILESLRIGNLDKKELDELKQSQKKDSNDPYANDPIRHPALKVNQETPFNAESPNSLLMDHFLTPPEIFFVRNHMPVPDINEKDHRLNVEGLSVKKSLILSVDQLKKNFEETSVTTAIQCAGNRRSDMNKYKKVQGLMWEGTAMGNAKWTGVRLRDVLIKAGVDPNDKQIKHVHFEGADSDPEGSHYGGSIPFEKAMKSECIIAYKMNDEAIPRDHGHPLRLIAPGIVGARQVKYLKTIRLSEEESPAHWQQKDYKAFPSSVQIGDPLDWSSVPSISEYPIQSYICIPSPGDKVKRGDEEVELSGYAWSGGGRGIIRVEISTDGGKTWKNSELQQDPEQDLEHMWAWTLWKATVKIPKDGNKFEVLCKATDRAYNTQPETPGALWNVRGLLNNSWHRVTLNIVD
uniref:Sulfite oxidase n=1 Tax=Panagrolaimus sp. ES5 TaxID=591445 RepID=A0AC34GTI0_9BILA